MPPVPGSGSEVRVILAGDMETMPRAALLEQLAGRVIGLRSGDPILVGVDGVDGAGKSTLAGELRSAVEACGRPAVHVELDDFQRPRERRNRRGPHSPEGCHEDVFDLEAISALLLEPLRSGRPFRLRHFDQATQRLHPEEWVSVGEGAVVIVDGGYLFRPELSGRWDLSLFVTVPPELSLRRGVERDLAHVLGREPMGEKEAAAVRERMEQRWRRGWLPAQRLYQQRVDPVRRVSAVIDNSDVERPGVEWRNPPEPSE